MNSMKFSADLELTPIIDHRLYLPGVRGQIIDVCECAVPGDRALTVDIEDLSGDIKNGTVTLEQKVLLLQELGWTIAGGHKPSREIA